MLGRAHEVRGLVVVGEGAEAIEPAALVIEIPAEILLPPAGEYLGFAAELRPRRRRQPARARRLGVVTARLVVLDRLGESPQRIEIFDVEAGAGRLPLAGAEGDVIRARFG